MFIAAPRDARGASGARGGSDGLYPVVREGPGPGVEVPAAVVRVFQAQYPKEEVRTSA